uniref:(northern house mosquito) hypothetical protein n=1 Tax=Culex pipiens TaxID=7175 RepID=A0A8D8MVG0_CULPI
MEQSHTTEIKTALVETKWTIKGFSAIKVGHLLSPKFAGTSAHTSRTLTWRYKLVPIEVGVSTSWTSIKVISGGQDNVGQSQFHADFEVEFNLAEKSKQVSSGTFDQEDKSIGPGMRTCGKVFVEERRVDTEHQGRSTRSGRRRSSESQNRVASRSTDVRSLCQLAVDGQKLQRYDAYRRWGNIHRPQGHPGGS